MNVLSLFNGQGCIWLALDELGIDVNKRYCSEIDKYANKVNNSNYPDSIQLGDVRGVKASEIERIDLLFGGSPCQGFSFAGKMLNFDDERSKLFFEYVRVLNEVREVNPDVLFLLENVNMKKQWQFVISKYLGVEPLTINSKRTSAQNRERLYWTNIRAEPFTLFGDKRPNIGQPKDRKIFLKDILQPESEVDKKYHLSQTAIRRILKYQETQSGSNIDPEKAGTITPSNTCKMDGDTTLIKLDVNGNPKTSQEKASCFTGGAHSGGNHSDMDVICVASRGRYGGGKASQRIEARSDGKTNSITTVGKDNFIQQRGRGYNKGGKHTEKSLTVSSNSWQNNHTVSNYRRLTPTEVERLFNIPDNYTASVSDSQRYKMLGNGWEIKAIVHILSHMPCLNT